MIIDNLNEIAEKIHQRFETVTHVRDQALLHSRKLIQQSAHSIRAIHREEQALALEHLNTAQSIFNTIQDDLSAFPDLYYAGYTQDAIKEFVEASITCALILEQPLPNPDDLKVEYATYLNGLAETSGELRRRCLDVLRHGFINEAQRLLECMDDIYGILVTMDYSDAITHGLRRQTDLVRGILERTRGDLTISLRQESLKQALEDFSTRFSSSKENANHPGQ